MNSLMLASVIIGEARFEGFAGYDPFDGLNSSAFDKISFLKKNSLFGLTWIQFHKRSPVNFRSFLGVRKCRNPKGVGLFVLGLLEDFERTGIRATLDEAQMLSDWLLTQQCDKTEWRLSCWGYHFDWMARAFFVPKGKPNVITTIYVAKALHKLAMVLSDLGSESELVCRYRDPAQEAAKFIVDFLYTEDGERCFFAYIPGEIAFVHNASLWAAAWVAVVASETGNTDFKDLAIKVAWQSVKEQQADGSWVYGGRHHHQFIDGFHTGYNLEALDLLQRALQFREFDDAIKRGLTYYKTSLIEEDGTAKYYHDNRYPLDMHSVSQALITLLKVGGGREDFLLAGKIAQRAIDTLYIPEKHRFVYQKNKFYTNRINYMRWTQAWVYYSFALLNNSRADDTIDGTD